MRFDTACAIIPFTFEVTFANLLRLDQLNIFSFRVATFTLPTNEDVLLSLMMIDSDMVKEESRTPNQ